MDCSETFANVDFLDTAADCLQPPRQSMALARDEVHVWSIKLDQPRSRVTRFLGTLTPDEQIRAERYYFVADRDRFIVARGVLRDILGNYLDQAPSNLRFSYNSYGKPKLIPEQAKTGLRFNLSHSHELALLAVSRSRELGVDIENIRPEIEVDQLADHFFSPPEAAMLRALPAQLRTNAFFNYWTRKEAYIKARGKGLSLPLAEFDVSRAPQEPISVLTKHSRREDTRWSLMELATAVGYAAAIVVEGRDWKLKCGDWRA